MALSAKLIMRQGQSLVMTPQLLQAIKLLQFSNMELTAFVQEELERNPLLERAEEAQELPEPASVNADVDPREAPLGQDFNEPIEADWNSESLATDRGALEASLGTELSNAFDDDRAAAPLDGAEFAEGAGL